MELLLGHLRGLLGHSQLGPPRDHGDICAFLNYVGLMQLQHVVLHRHQVLRVPVQTLGLQKYHGVLVPNGRQQKSFALNGVRRTHHFQSRRVCEVSLRRLAMVVSSVSHSRARRSDRQASAVECSSASLFIIQSSHSFISIKSYARFIYSYDLFGLFKSLYI